MKEAIGVKHRSEAKKEQGQVGCAGWIIKQLRNQQTDGHHQL